MDNDDLKLEDFFAAGRASPPAPSPELLQRVMSDAGRLQPDGAPVALAAGPAAVPGWRRMLGIIGGWPALTSFATATVAGLWFGYADMSGLTELIWPLEEEAGYGVADLLPDVDLYLNGSDV